MRTLTPLVLLALSGCFGDKPDDTGSDEPPRIDNDGDGFSMSEGDCSDADAGVYPGAPEYCDEKDNNCNGTVDESAVDALTWYRDADDDTYGDPDSTTAACTQPAGYVDNADDCDDTQTAANPWEEEVCDGIDNDCDGEVDEPDAADAPTWYQDDDHDGYGQDASTVVACEAPGGYAALGGDCDDTEAQANPGLEEVCDAIDNDCDGTSDEPDAVDAPTWYRDLDGDGYGTSDSTMIQCEQPSGYGAFPDECDDGDAAVYPGADELCNGIDDDCDGTTDEPDAIDALTWYADADADGYGDPAVTTPACSQPLGHVVDATDCDDTSDGANPGTDELCDGFDDDCDGVVDEDDAADAPTWYLDADADGYGLDTSTLVQCYAPTGYAALGGECDDAHPTVNPAATEVCDGIDNDCSGQVDGADAVDAATFYADSDGDGFGDPTSTRLACAQPSGYVGDVTDCDDGDATVYVGAPEVCDDGVVNDCDATAGEALWACGFGPTLELADAEVKLTGVSGNDQAGDSLAGAGDTDGDGLPDLLVGAYFVDTTATDVGAVYLLTSVTAGESSLSTAWATLTGDASQDYAGDAIAGAGDVDGDGYDDFIVGVWGDDTAATNAGVAWVVHGPVASGTQALSAIGTGLTGELSADGAGFAVGSAGDVNGDGLADLLIGSTADDTAGTSAGAAYLVLGPPSAGSLSGADQKLLGAERGGRAGKAVIGAGDLDGDGLGDLAVGAYYVDGTDADSGMVYWVLASSLPLDGSAIDLGTADAALSGTSGDAHAGTSLAAAGDVDGDGYDDVLVGSPGEATAGFDAGAAYLLLGLPTSGDLSAADAVIMPAATDGHVGHSVASAGDVDADGTPDLLIGAYGDSSVSTMAGTAYLLLGPVAGAVTLETDAQVAMDGEAASDMAGFAVAGVGDVDADGHDDLFIGAIGEDSGAPSSGSSGAAYLVYGQGY
ncbi:MAG: MopE-related protein [Pseudomonadota bacterium]